MYSYYSYYSYQAILSQYWYDSCYIAVIASIAHSSGLRILVFKKGYDKIDSFELPVLKRTYDQIASQTVCITDVCNKIVQLEVCITFSGADTGMNITAQVWIVRSARVRA